MDGFASDINPALNDDSNSLPDDSKGGADGYRTQGSRFPQSQKQIPKQVLETRGDDSNYDPKDITIDNQEISEGNLKSQESNLGRKNSNNLKYVDEKS